MNATVQLQVNNTRLVQNLALAFSSKTTFIAELMQNSRRAGATEIHLSYEARMDDAGKPQGTLVITDNGCGIQSWQDLLSLADSGWDGQVQAEERPYGIGFFSCVVSAKTVTVESGDQVLQFDSQDVLDFHELQVTGSSSHVTGTRITMTGLPLHLSNVEHAVQQYCLGFSVKVFFNQTEIAQPLSEQSLLANSADYEAVLKINGLGLCAFKKPDGPFKKPNYSWSPSTLSVSLFLLGIPVLKSGTSDVVIHLDPTLYPARLPDRDTLIDQADKLNEISKLVVAWWRVRMDVLKEALSVEDLWKLYPSVSREMLRSGLMNDVDRVPGFITKQVNEFSLLSWARDSHFDCHDQWITRESVETGATVLCFAPCRRHDWYHAVTHEIAHRKGWLQLVETVHKDHWLKNRLIDLGSHLDQVSVDYVSKASDSIDIDSVQLDVHLADAVTLRWMAHEVTVDDSAVIFVDAEQDDQGTLIIPGKAGASDAIGKISDFLDEGGSYTDDSYLGECTEELKNFLMALRGVSPAASLMSFVERSDYQFLSNTKNTCVLLVNPGCPRHLSLYAVDGGELLEAVSLYRESGMDSDKLQVLFEDVMKKMAASALETETRILEAMVFESFSKLSRNHGHMTALMRHDPSMSFKLSVQEKFASRVVGIKDWSSIEEDLDAAVKASIEATLALPVVK